MCSDKMCYSFQVRVGLVAVAEFFFHTCTGFDLAQKRRANITVKLFH